MGFKESDKLPRPPEYNLVHDHVRDDVMRNKERLLQQMIAMRTERLLNTLQTTKLADGLTKIEAQLKVQEVMREHGLFGLYMLLYSAFDHPQDGSAQYFQASGQVTDQLRALTDGQAAQRKETYGDTLGEYEGSITFGSRLHWQADDRIMLERVAAPKPGYQATIGGIKVYPDEALVPGESITFAPTDLAYTVSARRQDFSLDLAEAVVFNLPERRRDEGLLIVPISETTIYERGYISDEQSGKLFDTLQRFRPFAPDVT